MTIPSDSVEHRISDRIAEEAGAWDARLRAPDCADTDRAAFATWRQESPAHRAAFEHLQTIVATLRTEGSRADVRALRDAALRTTEQSRGRKFIAVAASVATFAIATTIWTTLPDGAALTSLRDLAASTARIAGLARERSRTYETGIGETSTITLQDGSSVELNARSRINVAFNESRRDVELVAGQAFFHVAGNPQRPFRVRAGDRDIIAIGTAFDVRLDEKSVSVTLIEGQVRVSESANIASSRSAQKTGAATLSPGQQLIARLPAAGGRPGADEAPSRASQPGPGAAVVLVRDIDVAQVTSWREGRVFLEDLTLADAVAEMNRHSPVQIVVNDPELANLRVNGMFRVGEQQAFVAALEQYFPITAERHGEAEIVLSPR
jgi:transmembrane sensor